MKWPLESILCSISTNLSLVLASIISCCPQEMAQTPHSLAFSSVFYPAASEHSEPQLDCTYLSLFKGGSGLLPHLPYPSCLLSSSHTSLPCSSKAPGPCHHGTFIHIIFQISSWNQPTVNVCSPWRPGLKRHCLRKASPGPGPQPGHRASPFSLSLPEPRSCVTSISV